MEPAAVVYEIFKRMARGFWSTIVFETFITCDKMSKRDITTTNKEEQW
jgi:hypothetical protein